MAFLEIKNVAIKGITACVPPTVEENIDMPFYAEGEALKVINSTGIVRRHVCTNGITASDLCFIAAKKMIKELGWEKETIDLVGYVTQNPDYINQPTSFIIHDKLDLPETCMCMDFFHGCPGWVVGLSSVMSRMSFGAIKKALLLDGDMLSHDISKMDREARPLFGDAGTCTALEYKEDASPVHFSIGTKSKDGKALIRQHGGYRNPFTIKSLKFELDKRAGEIPMSDVDDSMDSMDVFSFAITKVPKNLKTLCSNFEINISDINKLVLHQANKFMIETIAKKIKIEMDRVPLSLEEYGNTSSASIPLTIAGTCGEEYASKKIKTLACGFGTGLSWAAVYFETESIVCPKVIIYE